MANPDLEVTRTKESRHFAKQYIQGLIPQVQVHLTPLLTTKDLRKDLRLVDLDMYITTWMKIILDMFTM